MAPSMAAVLRAPRKCCSFSYVLLVFVLFYVLDVVCITVYDRHMLLNIGKTEKNASGKERKELASSSD